MTAITLAAPISVDRYHQLINAARQEEADLESEAADVGVRAIVDPGLVPKRDALRAKKRSREEDIRDLGRGLEDAQRREAEAVAAAMVDRRKEVLGVATGHIGELVEIVGEMDTMLGHLRTLITRSDAVEAAWRALVAQHVPPEQKGDRIFETLGLVKIQDHHDIAAALKEIDYHRSDTTVGNFRPRVENARLRAAEAPARIAKVLGIPVP